MPKDTTTPEMALARLTATVDQVLALVDTTMRSNSANRPLVDLCLDVKSALREARR